jgi:hypothetical protein
MVRGRHTHAAAGPIVYDYKLDKSSEGGGQSSEAAARQREGGGGGEGDNRWRRRGRRRGRRGRRGRRRGRSGGEGGGGEGYNEMLIERDGITEGAPAGFSGSGGEKTLF